MPAGNIVMYGMGSGGFGSIVASGMLVNTVLLVFSPAPRHLRFDVFVTRDLTFDLNIQ